MQDLVWFRSDEIAVAAAVGADGLTALVLVHVYGSSLGVGTFVGLILGLILGLIFLELILGFGLGIFLGPLLRLCCLDLALKQIRKIRPIIGAVGLWTVRIACIGCTAVANKQECQGADAPK